MIRAWGQSDAARTPAVVAGNKAIRPPGGCASTAFALRNHGAGRRDRIGSGNARRVRERAIVRIIPFFCGLLATQHTKSAGNETERTRWMPLARRVRERCGWPVRS
jgi:hypothetical protein